METWTLQDRKWVDEGPEYSALIPTLDYVSKGTDGKWHTYYRNKHYTLVASTQEDAKKECEALIRGILKQRVEHYNHLLSLLPDEVK